MNPKIKDILKENEQKIVKDSLNIALFRQDLALAVIESVLGIMETDSSKKFLFNELYRNVINKTKRIDPDLIKEILKLPLRQYKDERIKLEKNIIKSINIQ